jgi:sialate O-acetylesterase
MLVASLVFSSGHAMDQVSLPAIFGDHMVMQRDQPDPVWGWASPGASITVQIGEQSHATTADGAGAWRILLDPIHATGPLEMTIRSDKDGGVAYHDILIGEVWICSGQSNMEFPVDRVFNAEVELLSANYPRIRLMTIKKEFATDPLKNCEGQWATCTPGSVAKFSALGYFFGRRLNQALDVPIGLVDDSWGGSTAEAWISRREFEKHPNLLGKVTRWEKSVAAFAEGASPQVVPGESRSGRSGPAKDPRKSFGYGNIFNGMVSPVAGFGIRGMIWYQGESNASMPEQYRELFPMVIDSMRDAWGQGDFPFYWVQLADNYDEQKDPMPSRWAELREVQTQTMDQRPKTGQAVIIDVGRGFDGHPRNKQVPADRLVRWALANDYAFPIACQSPRYGSVRFDGGKAIITFEHVSDDGLISFDMRDPAGFSIAGEDRRFVWAEAAIMDKDHVQVWSDAVRSPVAVRYGWGDNPRVSLFDSNGLPTTPFRTDAWRDEHK